MSNLLSVGIIGCGSIASVLASRGQSFRIVSAYDTDPIVLASYAHTFGCTGYTDFSAFLSSPMDVVVEAASPEAVLSYGCDVVTKGKDLIVLSVGALADAVFRERLSACAQKSGSIIHIPPGAILGLDGLSIAQLSPADVVRIRTTKPAKTLGVDAKTRQCVFLGKASECIRHYPKNMNVSVALSLSAGYDVDVELWADPDAATNMHEIFFSGEYGRVYMKIENDPLPENPATSYRAALSVLSLLEGFSSPMVFGR